MNSRSDDVTLVPIDHVCPECRSIIDNLMRWTIFEGRVLCGKCAGQLRVQHKRKHVDDLPPIVRGSASALRKHLGLK